VGLRPDPDEWSLGRKVTIGIDLVCNVGLRLVNPRSRFSALIDAIGIDLVCKVGLRLAFINRIITKFKFNWN
jgi:hypothetical protein